MEKMRMESENYVYKKEIDWSTLMEGFTLPLDNQVIFLRNMENFLQRGQSKIIHFFMNGKTYDAKIVNMNNSVEKRKKDAYQIRYSRNGELSQALQQYFFKSMSYIKMIRESRDPKDRSYIKMPDGLKEYLVIYTTEYEDTFLLEPIAQDDFQVMKKAIQGMRERTVENEIEYEMEDKSSGIEKGSTQPRAVSDRLLMTPDLTRFWDLRNAKEESVKGTCVSEHLLAEMFFYLFAR